MDVSSHLPSSLPLSSTAAPCWPNGDCLAAALGKKKTHSPGNSSFPPPIFTPGSLELKVGSQPVGRDCRATERLWDHFQASVLWAKSPFEQPFSGFVPHPCSLLRQKNKTKPCLPASAHDLKRSGGGWGWGGSEGWPLFNRDIK